MISVLLFALLLFCGGLGLTVVVLFTIYALLRTAHDYLRKRFRGLT